MPSWLQYLTESKAWEVMPKGFQLGEHDAGEVVIYEWSIKNPTDHPLDLEWIASVDTGDDIFEILEAPTRLGGQEKGKLKLRWTVGFQPVAVKPRLEVKETLHVPVG